MRITALLLFIVYSFHATAQSRITWSDPVSVADKTFGNRHPRIALNRNNIPLVIWGDDNGKLYFSKDSDGVFLTPIELNPPDTKVFTETWTGPDIASNEDKVYIVFQCEQSEGAIGKNPRSDSVEERSFSSQSCNHIYIRHSYDGGVTFSIPEQIDDKKASIYRFPSVCTDDDGNPIVAFLQSDTDNANTHPVMSRSYDMGESFTHDTVINDRKSSDISDCIPPAVVSLGDNVAILYRNNIENLRNVWAGISQNKGYFFAKNVRMDSLRYISETCPASATSGMINGDTLYAVYMSAEDDNPAIYLSLVSITDSTFPITSMLYPTPSYTRQNFPRITHVGYTTAITWIQSTAASDRVCVAFTDSINTDIPRHCDTIADGSIANADIAMSRSNIFVVWPDAQTGKVMLRKGTYAYKNKAPEAVLNPVKLIPGKTENLFTVKIKNVVSCMATDNMGRKFEVDFLLKKDDCYISAEDLESGSYKLEITDESGKKYHADMEVK